MIAFFDLEGADLWARFHSGYYGPITPTSEGPATYSTLDELIGEETY